MSVTKTHLSRIALSLAVMAALPLLNGCTGDEQEQAPQLPPPLVSTLEIVREDVPLQSKFMGQTLGYLSVEVRAQVAGILKRRAYKEGDYVQQGQLLFEIDPAPYQAALEQAQGQLVVAQAQLTNSRRELDRILPLYASNAVSQRDRDSAQSAYDSAKAQVDSAQARVHEAEIQLGYTRVVAPISGFTSREARNEGNLVSLDAAGSLLTTINQTNPMYVTFAIPSSEMLMMKRLESQGRAVGYKEGALVTLEMLEGDSYAQIGRVTFLDTQIDPYTSVVRARAQFDNKEGVLLPGQYATVTISGNKLLNAVMIPQSAVMQTAQGQMVYVLDENNVATMTPVALEQGFGQEFLVKSGVNDGDVIVVEGTNKVRPGSPVTPKPLPKPERQEALPTPDSVYSEGETPSANPAALAQENNPADPALLAGVRPGPTPNAQETAVQSAR